MRYPTTRSAGLVSMLAHVFLLTTWTGIGAAQGGRADQRFERIATVIREQMAAYGIPGVALGISYRGARHTRGFGVTSVENPLPVSETTLFQAGSITKTFTATVAIRLVDEGKLSLDAPVQQYLPAFRVQDEEASRQTTLRTLLTHMGGWEGDFFPDAGDGDEALAGAVLQMSALRQVTPFNTTWSYNNSGFLIAGRLIEVVTRQPYERAIRDMLIAPLGLRRTYLFPSEVMIHRFAVGHAGPIDRPVVLRPWALPRVLRAVGGIITTADDLLRYAEFHLGDGSAPDGSRILSTPSMRQMHQTQVIKRGSDEEMALGWQVSSIGTHREMWHDGATLGQQALLSLVPDEHLAVVVLTNSVRGGRLNRAVRRAVALQYLGVSLRDPDPIAVPIEQLREYVGSYSRRFMDVNVSLAGDRVMIQTVQKRGFPEARSPIPPPAPPVPYASYARDRLIGLGPVEGDHVEFLRGPHGGVGCIRVLGRVACRRDAR